ncbi:MAG: acyltransferase [Bacteroidetes bacterium]|nr:acyltransferase [Bacteroidota bacterium]
MFTTKEKVYFPNLNGVRFVAALGVIAHHIEQAKNIYGLDNIYTNSFVGGVFGKLGIIMFFVLSGFLITYLLLKEKEKTGTISVRNFYIRRIFRIWPLYYLIIFLGIFVLPHFNFFYIPYLSDHVNDSWGLKLFVFLFFLPNVADMLFRSAPAPFINQTWSVGVEEQFYLMWPWIVKYSKNILKVLLIIIGVYFAVRTTFFVWHINTPDNKVVSDINYFWEYFCIDDMALGGIMAWILYYKKEKALKFLFHKYTQLVTYMVIVFLAVRGISVPFVTFEVYAVPFAVMIINLAANKNTLVTFDFKVLDYLGKVTYGLYMYHGIAIIFGIRAVLAWIPKQNLVLSNVVLYLVIFGSCILMTILSYELFESPFLKAKMKYSKIISGDNAKHLAEEGQQPEQDTPVSATVPTLS